MLAAMLSVAALITVAVCAVLIVGEQRHQTRLARETACYQRSAAWAALFAGDVGPDSSAAAKSLYSSYEGASYDACTRLDVSPHFTVPTPTTTTP